MAEALALGVFIGVVTVCPVLVYDKNTWGKQYLEYVKRLDKVCYRKPFLVLDEVYYGIWKKSVGRRSLKSRLRGAFPMSKIINSLYYLTKSDVERRLIVNYAVKVIAGIIQAPNYKLASYLPLVQEVYQEPFEAFLEYASKNGDIGTSDLSESDQQLLLKVLFYTVVEPLIRLDDITKCRAIEKLCNHLDSTDGIMMTI